MTAKSAWDHIERLLIDECGLLPDQGLNQQRSNFITAIRNAGVSVNLAEAAAELLRVGSLASIRVDGRMMTREQVAAALITAK